MKPKDLDKQWKAKVGKDVQANPLDQLGEMLEFADTRPPGGFTIAEAVAKYGLSKRGMRDRLEKMVRVGRAIRHQSPGCHHVYYTLPGPTRRGRAA